MPKLLSILFMAMVILSNTVAGSAGKDVELQVIDQKPLVDGKLDDDCWKNAKWYKGFSPVNPQGQKAADTEFAILYNNHILYLGIVCHEEKGEKTISKKREADGAVHADDSVEFMLITSEDLPPDENLLSYMHFIINSAGQKYDAIRSSGLADKSWDAGWKVKTRVAEDRWTAEIAIDCASLDITSKSLTWHFNICRSKPGKKYASWANISDFHQKRNYPLLTGIPKEILNNYFTFSDISLEQDNGLVKLKTNITNNGIYTGKAVFNLITISDRQNPESYSYDFETESPGQTPVLIPTKIEKSGTYRIFGIIKDDNGKILKTVTRTLAIAISPLKIAITAPCYRDNIYHTGKLNTIDFTADVDLRNHKSYTLKATLTSHKDNNVVSEAVISVANRQKTDFRLPVKELGTGEYDLQVVLLQDNKKIAESRRTLRKLPEAPGDEVRIDRENNIVVNGKKFFPWGFMGARADKHSYLSKAGFNTVQSYTFENKDIEDARKELDEWHRAGIKVILYPYYKTFFKGGHFTGPNAPGISSDELELLKNRVEALKSHPAILAWYLCDEPRGAKKIEALKKVYELLREVDPYHPCVVLNNSVDGCLDIQDAGDILYPDIYPNFKEKGGSVSSLSVISNSVKAIYRGSGGFKPVIFAAQTFDYGAYYSPELYRAPDYEEVRGMIYLAIVSNIKGLVNFKIGEHDWREKGFSEKSAGIYATKSLSTGMLEGLGPEIGFLTGVFTASPSTIKVEVKSKDILFMTRTTEKGGLYIICVNQSDKTVHTEISVLDNGIERLNVFPEGREVVLENNKFHDGFAPYEAHVYTTDSKLPGIKTVREIKNIISGAKD